MQRLVILIWSILTISVSSAQSEVEIYNRILETRNPNTVLEILKGVPLSEVENDSLRSYFYYYKGTALAQLGELEESLVFIDSAQIGIGPEKYPLVYIQIWRALGNIAWIRSFYNIALEHYQSGLELSQQIDNSEFQISLLGNIAGVYAQLDDYQRALDYALKAEEVSKASGVSRPRSHMKIGLYQIELGNAEQAIESLNETIGRLNVDGRDSIALGVVNYNIARAYLDLKRPQSAWVYLNLSDEIFERIGYTDAHLKNETGRYYFQIGAYEESSRNLEEAIVMAQNSQDMIKESSAIELLAEVKRKQGDLSSVVDLQNRLIALNDSIKAKETLNKVYELETQFQVAQRQAEIERLRLENSLQEANLAKSRNAQLAIGVGSFLSIILIIVFFMLRHKKHAAEREAQELQIEALKKRVMEIQSSADTTINIGLNEFNQKLHNDLTEREFEILRLSLENKTNTEISEKLFISVSTVKFHLRNTYAKLGVSNRKEALDYVVKKS